VKTTIALFHKDGENAVPLLLKGLQDEVPSIEKCFGLLTASKHIERASLKEIETQGICSQVAIGFTSSGTTARTTQPLILSGKEETVMFDGTIFSQSPKVGLDEIIDRKRKYPTANEAIKAFLKEVESDFSLFVAQNKNILAARDPVGVEPLYFGDNKRVLAIASTRKALWKIGIEETKSFPPGYLGVASVEGFRFEPVKILTFRQPNQISMNEASKTLKVLLEHAVQARVFGQKEVAVAFSGGLDSSVVAHLAKQSGVNVQLLHVSLEGQPETAEAIEAAEMLDLPLQVCLFSESELEKAVPKVVSLIEETDPVKAGIGVPFFWTAQKASEKGYKVMLAGQGADELFGGYLRYVREYMKLGDEKVRKTMFSDVELIYESNIERDEKIFSFYDVKLRLPFASYQVVEFAMSLPTELKFENSRDSLRKLVLRKTAENLGIPLEIVNKPKKAVQYSTGISDALKKLAKKKNLTFREYITETFNETKILRNNS
jgi:asparagine synthase (glutamine-hydrolysing)